MTELLIESKAIANEVVENYRSARYEVITIVPLTKTPMKNSYLFDREQLDGFLEEYTGDAEVLVSITPVKGIA